MKEKQDINELEQKIKKFQKKEALKQKIPDEERETFGAATGFQMSVELISGVLVGAAIGYFIDLVFNFAPWGLAAFTILGGAAGFLNIYKTSKTK